MISGLSWGYLKKEFTVQAEKNVKLRIAHVYYPGWEVFINGKRSEIKYDNPGGLMEISVPKGKNNITFVFKRTSWRYLADAISLIGLIIFLLLAIREIIQSHGRNDNFVSE